VQVHGAACREAPVASVLVDAEAADVEQVQLEADAELGQGHTQKIN